MLMETGLNRTANCGSSFNKHLHYKEQDVDEMVNQREDLLTRAVVLSDRLNEYLQGYLEKTKELGKILNNKDEDENLLLEVIAERQTIIEQYDVLKKEYEQLLKLSAAEFEHSPKAQKDDLERKLADLQQSRKRLLKDVSQLDDNNRKMLKLLHEDYKVKLKQVNEGKLLLDTYYGPSTVREGAFIDKTE